MSNEVKVDLNIADIPYPSGVIKFRYARYMSEDGTQWIRHGLFEAFYESGVLASSGNFEHGKESGLWRAYHESGQLAAEGYYENGKEVGTWNYWRSDGSPD